MLVSADLRNVYKIHHKLPSKGQNQLVFPLSEGPINSSFFSFTGNFP